MSKFKEIKTNFDGLVRIERTPIGDHRGFLERLFCVSNIKAWKNRKIFQINRTKTLQAGVIRGLHFQYPPFSECKYVTCLKGRVFDVALDLRLSSSTYGQCYKLELDSEKRNALIIPEGFAHGFQTLTTNVEMFYIHSAIYNSEYESGINAFTKDLSIQWPQVCSDISERDKVFPNLESFKGINL